MALLIGAACMSSARDLPGQPPAAEQTANIGELSPMMDAFIDAWNGGDPEVMMALFAEGAVLIDASRRFNGLDEIRSFVVPEVTGYRIRILDVEAIREDGQRILVSVMPGGVGDGFRATFDLTVQNGRIVLANLQYA
jgi:hypothetical protein